MSAPVTEKIRGILPELVRFAVVGGLGYATDVLLFLLFRQMDLLAALPAKVLSLTASTAVAFIGNKYWTYRERRADQRSADLGRETALFLAVNIGGALIQLACLWFSHYLLHLTSATADLLSGSVVGMALATAARFWGTRTLVFRSSDDGRANSH